MKQIMDKFLGRYNNSAYVVNKAPEYKGLMDVNERIYPEKPVLSSVNKRLDNYLSDVLKN